MAAVYAFGVGVDRSLSTSDTVGVPALLKIRLAVIALIGIFLIPIGGSALRGISHVLTCTDQVATPFQVILSDGVPIVTGSTTLSADEPTTLCGGLVVDIAVVLLGQGALGLDVSITNLSGADWFGTVQLLVGATRIPIDMGRVSAGETAQRSVPLHVPEGTVEFDGSLLIGP